MQKLEQIQRNPLEETLIARAVARELKRRDLMRAVCSSHRVSGTAPVPEPDPVKRQ